MYFSEYCCEIRELLKIQIITDKTTCTFIIRRIRCQCFKAKQKVQKVMQKRQCQGQKSIKARCKTYSFSSRGGRFVVEICSSSSSISQGRNKIRQNTVQSNYCDITGDYIDLQTRTAMKNQCFSDNKIYFCKITQKFSVKVVFAFRQVQNTTKIKFSRFWFDIYCYLDS